MFHAQILYVDIIVQIRVITKEKVHRLAVYSLFLENCWKRRHFMEKENMGRFSSFLEVI